MFIAGRSDSPKGPQDCILFQDDVTGEWVVTGVKVTSTRKKYDSVATGIAHGSGSAVDELMVVGITPTPKNNTLLRPSFGLETLFWKIGYLYDLECILTKTGTGEESGMGSDWVLDEATGVSAARDRFVGWGI